jgi:7-carboxy-7-deazaguanine synthase
MLISEMFASIQGEGILAGVPSLFIRLSGCNLRCVWCDTPYTSWNPEGARQTVSEVMNWVRSRAACRHVVVTGGEPMLSEEVVELTAALRREEFHITIETAGTVWQPVSCDLMSISPKLANSTPWHRESGRWGQTHERLRIQPDVLSRLMAEFSYQLKFVVSSPGDLQEICDLAKTLNAPAHSILLMPEGTDPASLMERSAWLVDVCKQTGFRYSPRLHVLLWGNRRGV